MECDLPSRLFWFILGGFAGMITLPGVLVAFMWMANELHKAKHGGR